MTECSQNELAQIVGGGGSRPSLSSGQSDKIEIGRPGFVKRPPLARI
ncbi:bacteriocin [Streptococcus rubneri]|uniref:Bacteriocin n=1 Tax=Streptococcus rubneri TaxID=1234680 RepID=A0A4Z1DSD2_9STRE|nr:bacteriocin [Streptococcus rubneri]TGN91195.1 bacteriocin [Streptococcus rubneri]